MNRIILIFTLFHCSITFSQDFAPVGMDSIEYTKTGKGEPWIVLVSGLGGSIHAYDTIYDNLSDETTVIRYSRAGLGNSTYNINHKSYTGIIDEMEAFLDAIEAPDSIILVGHSYGGLIIRTYAKEHPEQVIGLVSLDPTFEDYFPVLEKFYPNARALETNWIDSTITKAIIDEAYSLIEVWNSPGSWNDQFSYDPNIPHFCISSLKTFPDIELRSTDEIMQARYDVHERIVNTSNVHMHMSLPQAGHGIQWDAPNVTVGTILLMLNMIRNKDEE